MQFPRVFGVNNLENYIYSPTSPTAQYSLTPGTMALPGLFEF